MGDYVDLSRGFRELRHVFPFQCLVNCQPVLTETHTLGRRLLGPCELRRHDQCCCLFVSVHVNQKYFRTLSTQVCRCFTVL